MNNETRRRNIIQRLDHVLSLLKAHNGEEIVAQEHQLHIAIEDLQNFCRLRQNHNMLFSPAGHYWLHIIHASRHKDAESLMFRNLCRQQEPLTLSEAVVLLRFELLRWKDVAYDFRYLNWLLETNPWPPQERLDRWAEENTPEGKAARQKERDEYKAERKRIAKLVADSTDPMIEIARDSSPCVMTDAQMTELQRRTKLLCGYDTRDPGGIFLCGGINALEQELDEPIDPNDTDLRIELQPFLDENDAKSNN